MHKTKSFPAILFFFALCTIINQTKAQNYKKNRYNLEIIDNITDYRREITADKLAKLVPLFDCVPHLKTDFVYATDKNFTHSVLYKNPKPFALITMARALNKASGILEKKGLGIWLFDAYRPYSVTEKMWEAEPDARYAAVPKIGSGHNRGISVDITLYNLSTGKLLRMPTGFDNFTDSAHSDFIQLPDEVLRNRALLKSVMESCGLQQLSTEWWHFSIPNPNGKYKILDLGFDTLDKFVAKSE